MPDNFGVVGFLGFPFLEEAQMAKRAAVQALKNRVANEFESAWKDKVVAKEAKMKDAIGALARKYRRSEVSIRIYLTQAGLTKRRRGRRGGRKPGRPAQAAAGGVGGGNAIAKLIKLSRKIEVLKRRVARLEAARKLLARSPAIRALLS